jgi:GNAT superfamily N-acetyltransferase
MKSGADLKIVFKQDGGGDAQVVRDRLDIFNVGVTGESTYYPVNYILKNERDEVMGGLLGAIWGGWLHITYLWVDPAVRGQDFATRMMDQAEAYARERHCHSIMLDTHSFQARPFYEKRGFEVFATLDDWPKPHKKFFLKKKL